MRRFTRTQWRKARAVLESRALDPFSDDPLEAELAEAMGIEHVPAPYRRPPKRGTFARLLHDQADELCRQYMSRTVEQLQRNRQIATRLLDGNGRITFSEHPLTPRKEVTPMAKKQPAPAKPAKSTKKKGKGGRC